jgi:HEPN domain-containing protein
MAEQSVASLLLAAAMRDRQAFLALIAVPDMNETVIGFHAHQCIEKALKAVLTHADVAFRRTHDVAELLDLLHDVGRTAPPFADSLEELNPYAIEARYGLVEPAGLDRKATSRMVEGVIAWAEKQLAMPA